MLLDFRKFETFNFQYNETLFSVVVIVGLYFKVKFESRPSSDQFLNHNLLLNAGKIGQCAVSVCWRQVNEFLTEGITS